MRSRLVGGKVAGRKGAKAEGSQKLGQDEAEKFGKAAGIRNADQVDARFLQRSYEPSLAPGLQDHECPHRRHGRAGCRRRRHLPRRPQRAVDPVLDHRPHRWGDSAYNHLEPVGVRIYNRWLADFVSEAPERHVGIAHIPISDPEACAQEVEWAAEAGLKGINLPAPRGDFPMLNDPVWEPLWAACEETGMSLNTHGGGGEHYPYQGQGAQAMYMMETPWRTRRGVWVMILGGVFERHPGLKLVLTEQWIDWAPQVMADMDGLYHGPTGAAIRATLPKPPSEYFRQNCFIGASFLSNWEAKFAIEHDLVANAMWGDDYPHAEGTWPHTREAMRFTFSDIDPKYTRQFLGDTAIDVYGLDRAEAEEGRRPDRPDRRRGRHALHAARRRRGGLYAFRTGPGIFV